MTSRVDSHQHFWRLDRADYGWLTPGLEALYRDFLPPDLEPALQRCSIEATILVQAAPTLAETAFLLELADTHAFIAGVVGWVDFESPDAARTIASLARHPRLVGLRPMVQDIPDHEWLLRDSIEPAIAAMRDHDLVFDALVRPAHLPALRRFVARYPELKVVVDHAAKPRIGCGEFDDWSRDVGAIAAESAARCKLSGLVTEATTATPAPLRRYVDRLLEVFGPRRLMWGSDWPVCELVCSYDDWWQTTQALLAGLPTHELQYLMGETARETYGI